MELKVVIISALITGFIYYVLNHNPNKRQPKKPVCYHCETADKIKFYNTNFFCEFCERIIDSDYMRNKHFEHFIHLQKEYKDKKK